MKNRRPATLPHFWRSVTTDNKGEFDVGRIMTPLAVGAMIAIAAYDTIVNGREFDAQGLGIGIAAVLGALGFYLFGDHKAQQQPPPINPAAKSAR